MRRLRPAVLAVALGLVVVGGASGEVVARGVQDGMLALGSKGRPFVAYVRGTRVVISIRASTRRWRGETVGSASRGSRVMAFGVGASGPVAVIQNADGRSLVLVRRHGAGWQAIRLVSRLPAQISLGWPGLAFDRRGRPVVSYTRWNYVTLDTQLVLARIDARGRVRSERITREGFPKSAVPPPAVPVRVGGRMHVIESYGFRGVLGTFEWFPQRRTWIGFNLDSGVGDFPVGPVLAGLSRGGVLYAAWTESLVFFDKVPVTLAVRRHEASSEFVLDRALTRALVLPRSGPEIAANEWVGADELGLVGDAVVWAGMVLRETTGVELDGWIAGFAVAPRAGRDLLLAGPGGLSWFRAPRMLATRVSIDAVAEPDGAVHLSGNVRGVSGGRVTLYRERPGRARTAIGKAPLVNGSFSHLDRPPARPLLYRAVYRDPASGIPYAALLRQPVP
jgi:hypothetical protein